MMKANQPTAHSLYGTETRLLTAQEAVIGGAGLVSVALKKDMLAERAETQLGSTLTLQTPTLAG